jgi:HicA toxin of bacterial toxin-antitoxin,
MGQANLPLACGDAHASAFERLGWIRDHKRRGRGKHILLTKPGMRPTLSIPDHHEVKRTIIASQIKIAGILEAEYIAAFYGK